MKPSPKKALGQRLGRKLAAALSTLAVVATSVVATTVVVATPASAAPSADQCPVGSWPNMGNVPLFADNNVTLWAAGDVLLNNAEVEGLMVVEKDLTIDRSPGGLYNVGWVGVGSQILPNDNEPMLIVGGDLDLSSANTTAVQVGKSPDRVGQYMVGGAISDPGKFDVGTSVPYDVTGTYAENFDATVAAADATFKAAATTGSFTQNGSVLEFSGDGLSLLQVFDVPGASLGASNVQVSLDNIPAGASVVFRVAGAAPVTIHHSLTYELNGVDVPWNTAASGSFAAHTLWHFTEATDITIGESGGYDGQFLGTVFAPVAGSNVETNESINGRVYVNGNLSMLGSGRELHNYPFQGYLPFSCQDDGNPTQPPVLPAVTPVAPTVTTGCGSSFDVILPTTTGVVYSKSRSGNKITVTATPASGYRFPAGVTSSWEFTVKDCDDSGNPNNPDPNNPDNVGEKVVKLVKPVANDRCGSEYDATLPKTEGVQYTKERSGDKIIVTATPEDGYVFEDGARAEWTFTIKKCTDSGADSTSGNNTNSGSNSSGSAGGSDSTSNSNGSSGGRLSDTGAEVTGLVLAAVLLLMVGGGALLVARKRA
ncbi:collagen-binding domain-containing protein [Populibacterium corticicola]|uniref:collagen-binding domain-containing protein n=1 Tax=Populibacterium corticicola TaxID=1812826 RepID=UPI00366D4350